MVHFFRTRSAKNHIKVPRPFLQRKRPLAGDFRINESPANSPKHILIVMDGMREFTTKALEWTLENLISAAGCTVTLLGVMPWLNIPLAYKTQLDVWSVISEEFGFAGDKSCEWKCDLKYLKLKAVIELCKSYGVTLRKKVVMGYPSRLLVVEQITSLHPTWVVFDRHQKNMDFYSKRIPCNLVVMNEDGQVDMIKGQPIIDSGGSTPAGDSPALLLPPPELIISDKLKGILKERSQGSHEFS
ncbi:hypothetical protein UlMin_001137 [Ulmus minor]